MRDPRIDPQVGDLLKVSGNGTIIAVDFVENEQVYYRMIGRDCIRMSRAKIEDWKDEAPEKLELMEAT